MDFLKKHLLAGRRLKFLGFTLMLGGVLISVPLFTQKNFDPNSVQPTNCANGKMKCGFVPLNAAERKAVPQDPANMIRHRGLPSRVDLSSNMPPIGNQGRQGSCVGWASTYGIKSYQEKVERRWSYSRHAQNGGAGNHVFSPAWTYNQINGGRDRGSNPVTALRLLSTKGAAPWKEMPYSDRNYTRRPPGKAFNEAKKYKIKSYKMLNQANPSSLKSVLAKGNMILAGIKVYDNFYRLGSGVYTSGTGTFRGGHAIVLMGYDDKKRAANGDRGAFRIFNSWGTGWGRRGYGWVSYRGLTRIGLGAMAVYDKKDSNAPIVDPNPKPNNDDPVPPTPVNPQKKKTPMKAPDSITASRGSYGDRVSLSWSRVDGAVAYEVHRASPGSQSFSKVGYSERTNYTDRGVTQGFAYSYKIVTVGEDKKSNIYDSPVAQGYAKKAEQNEKPAQVGGLEATLGSNGKVQLSWNAVSGASRYQVIRFDVRRRKWKSMGRSRSANYQDRSPQRSAKNYYRVRAKNSAGYGQWSDNAVVSGGGGSEKPAKVQSITVSKGKHKNGIQINWSRVPGATGYMIVRYNGKKKKFTGQLRSTGSSIMDSAGEVKRGGVFAYAVVAYNSAGYGPYSKWEGGYARAGKFRGASSPPPENVTGKINHQKGTVTLNWSKVKGASQYYIFRKKHGKRRWKFVKDVSGSTTSYTAKIPGKAGTLYLYSVKSKPLMGGESGNSKAVGAFVNAKKARTKHRFFFTNDGFEKFKGRWTAVDWDGESAPKKLVLTLARKGKKFTGVFQIDSERPRKFSGTYIAKSNSLVTEGFTMQLAPTSQGAGSVEIQDGDDDDISISFLREK